MIGGAWSWVKTHATPGRIVVLGLMAVASAAALLGSGYWSSDIQLGHADQWVANSADGEIAHITGPSAAVDARIIVADEGDSLSVSQGDEGVYVLNRESGQLRRIDESTFAAEASQLVTAGQSVSVLPGPDGVYVIDGTEGEALYLDPVSLAVRETHQISGGDLSGAVDADGTLWVTQPEDGQLLEIRRSEVGDVLPVGDPGDQLRVVLDGGLPGVFNLTAGTWSAPSRQDAVDLPELEDDSEPAAPRLGAWPTPSYTAGGSWISFSEGGDTQTKAELAPGNELGRAAITQETVFVPDLTSGRVYLVDSTSGDLLEDPEVLPEGDQMAVGARDGFGFVTQEGGRAAWVIDPEGEVGEVQLDDPDAIQFDDEGNDVTPEGGAEDEDEEEGDEEESESATGVVDEPEEVELCDVNPNAPECEPDEGGGGGDDCDADPDGPGCVEEVDPGAACAAAGGRTEGEECVLPCPGGVGEVPAGESTNDFCEKKACGPQPAVFAGETCSNRECGELPPVPGDQSCGTRECTAVGPVPGNEQCPTHRECDVVGSTPVETPCPQTKDCYPSGKVLSTEACPTQQCEIVGPSSGEVQCPAVKDCFPSGRALATQSCPPQECPGYGSSSGDVQCPPPPTPMKPCFPSGEVPETQPCPLQECEGYGPSPGESPCPPPPPPPPASPAPVGAVASPSSWPDLVPVASTNHPPGSPPS